MEVAHDQGNGGRTVILGPIGQGPNPLTWYAWRIDNVTCRAFDNRVN